MRKKNKIKELNEYKKQKENNYKNRERLKAKPKKRLKKKAKVLLVIFTFVPIIAYICGYSVVSKMKYDIHYLEKDLRKKEIVLEQLKARTYEGRSVESMEENAREKLHMDYPTNNNIEYIEVDY